MGRGPGLSALEKNELWRRWQKGERISDIARALVRRPNAVAYVLSTRGGIAPPALSRASRALALPEREEISRGLIAGLSLRAIAARMGRAASTVSREIARNGGREHYRAALADRHAWQQAERPKRCRLALNRCLQRVVARQLKNDWSPQQIAGWLKAQYPDNEAMQVSHETIYRSLFVQARNVLKRELIAHLRSQRTMRRGNRWYPHSGIVGAVSIRERPADVEDRAVPGHWEGDLLSGSNNTHIATLVERYSRYVMLVRVTGKDTDSVVKGLIRQVKTLPDGLMASLTWDRGPEMAGHKRFSIATDVKVYFCDPKSPWQRGSNENTNGLLRQYFPHGADLSGYTQRDLNKIAQKLNTRPRKTLGYSTPAIKLAEALR